MAPQNLVRLGIIARAHGVRGEVKIAPDHPDSDTLLNSPSIWIEAEGGPREYKLLRAKMATGVIIASLEGVSDRDAAELLRGRIIYLPEERLPPLEPGEIYLYQLVGLAAVTTAGEALGEVEGTLETGANPVLVVKGPKGEYLLPFIDDVVKAIDLEGRRITIELLEGLEPT